MNKSILYFAAFSLAGKGREGAIIISYSPIFTFLIFIFLICYLFFFLLVFVPQSMSYFLFPISFFRFLISDFLFNISSDFLFPISDFLFLHLSFVIMSYFLHFAAHSLLAGKRRSRRGNLIFQHL